MATQRSKRRGRFTRTNASGLLVACHRRCCICHRWCGSKIELDHIVPVAKGGADDVANAIALCFDCHAEAHAYNDKHPRGRKFTPDELRRHRDQWLDICRTRPEIFVSGPVATTAGPLEALLTELQVNYTLADLSSSDPRLGAWSRFHDEEYRRAIASGSLAILEHEPRRAVVVAYAMVARANDLTAKAHRALDGREESSRNAEAGRFAKEVREHLATAYATLVTLHAR